MTDKPFSNILSRLNPMLREAPPSTDSEDIYIMCLGSTGCGSSTFINNLIQDSTDPLMEPMKIGTTLSSCTSSTQWTNITPNRPSDWTEKYKLWVGDTPGFANGEEQLTDAAITQNVLESMKQRLNAPEAPPCRLGVLLLQDIGEERPRLPADINTIRIEAASRVLKNLTVVTTKWRPSAEGANHDPGSSRDALLAPNPDPREIEKERKQEQIRNLLSPADVTLDANRAPGDEWRIVEQLIKRVVEDNWVLQLSESQSQKEAESPATIKTDLVGKRKPTRFRRWLGWIICRAANSD